MPVAASSRITHVSVHARGAIVTRAVEVPAGLSDGEVDLIVAELTPLADPGSLRAELTGARQVVSVASRLEVPSLPARAGASVEKLQELRRSIERLATERAHLETRRAQLAELALTPRGRFRKEDPVDARFADALAASALVGEVTARLDERVAALDVKTRELQHQLDAAALDDAQRASAERMGSGHPTRQVTVRLRGTGAVESLSLSYVVPAARWWPVYTLRLSDGGKRASWWMEALVAQLSGEDWSAVKLSLATADLIHDARLPELPSLRLGRAQPKPKKAYRPPPEGLDRMFEAYDRANAPPPPPPRPEPVFAPPPAPVMQPGASFAVGGAASFDDGAPPEAKRRSLSRGAAMPQSMPKSMPMSVAAAPERAMTMDKDEAPPEEPADIEPADAWLEFDALTLAGLGEARRGRLVLSAAQPLPGELAGAAARIGSLAPQKARDPRDSRGLFDHRYDAAGAADLPSDGLIHRITVGIAEAPSQLFWRTVPREAAEVYKEAHLTNPFASPLLAGPVDVYVEGSLLTTSEIDRIDVGGAMTIGLGVEDGIRVARNARVDESTAGLLGGSIVVDSEVTIDLTSSLGREAKVEVVDRIPVTDEDGLDVELISSKPEAAEYDQSDRGSPIRKGLRWSLPLPPSGKGKVVFRYKLSFSGKSEIVGGNRRE